MNNQEIIDWKIATLANEHDATPSKEMQNYLKQNPELQAELQFIEQFWGSGVEPPVMPSDKLDANFYQMLSKAQSAQQQAFVESSHTASSKEQSLSLIAKVKTWLTPTSFAQFATMALVFVLGFNLNRAPYEAESQLQQQVSSLTTILAMSLLQKDSATERLSGVAYSQQTGLTDPKLIEQLINVLAQDKSTSVRLAAINSLSDLTAFDSSEQRLFTLAAQEDNLLVQIELCRLLLNYGSVDIKKRLAEQANLQRFKPEVRSLIQAQLLASHI